VGHVIESHHSFDATHPEEDLIDCWDPALQELLCGTKYFDARTETLFYLHTKRNRNGLEFKMGNESFRFEITVSIAMAMDCRKDFFVDPTTLML